MELKIGILAKRTGTNAPTIRYYEEIGLLPPAKRREGGQRRYGEDDVKRLTFIRRCRDFGLSVEQVRRLAMVVQDPGRSCIEARDLAKHHLDAIRAKLHELKVLERTIASFVQNCDRRCAGGPGPECVILEDLGAPKAGSRRRRRNDA
jgi:DNA-binding transcriptional MerR regulator